MTVVPRPKRHCVKPPIVDIDNAIGSGNEWAARIRVGAHIDITYSDDDI